MDYFKTMLLWVKETTGYLNKVLAYLWRGITQTTKINYQGKQLKETCTVDATTVKK